MTALEEHTVAASRASAGGDDVKRPVVAEIKKNMGSTWPVELRVVMVAVVLENSGACCRSVFYKTRHDVEVAHGRPV